jgi:hypothetical protein
VNSQEISQEIAPIKDHEEACQILIKGFNEFILNVLSKSSQLLGPKMIQRIIQEINTVLPGVDTAQSRISDKDHVIGEIKNVLSQALERLGKKQVETK